MCDQYVTGMSRSGWVGVREEMVRYLNVSGPRRLASSGDIRVTTANAYLGVLFGVRVNSTLGLRLTNPYFSSMASFMSIRLRINLSFSTSMISGFCG